VELVGWNWSVAAGRVELVGCSWSGGAGRVELVGWNWSGGAGRVEQPEELHVGAFRLRSCSG